MKKLSPKQFFLLLYLLSAGSMAAGIFLPNVLWTEMPLFYGLPYFMLPFIGIIATFLVILAIPRVRMALRQIEIPKKYSPKHFLLLLWLSAQALILDIVLHNGIYALGIACFGWGFWGEGDEPVFFFIGLIVVPAGLVAGAFGRLWDWCVTQPVEQMKAKGIQLPTTWGYFAPFASYGWLWKFGKGIEVITARRIRAAGVFASVFFLGFLGLVIIRYRLAKLTA